MSVWECPRMLGVGAALVLAARGEASVLVLSLPGPPGGHGALTGPGGGGKGERRAPLFSVRSGWQAASRGNCTPGLETRCVLSA